MAFSARRAVKEVQYVHSRLAPSPRPTNSSAEESTARGVRYGSILPGLKTSPTAREAPLFYGAASAAALPGEPK
ncbi:hypothetical protein J6590_068450 [Homalodisca vitripennis]|nr:hypothetical protein J6590_068450 [Homalodisca vitripennis]